MKNFTDKLYRKIPMGPIDWLVDCVIVAGVFGFGLLQLTLSVDLVFPDEFTRRMLGIRSVSPSLFSVLAVFLISMPVIARRKFPWIAYIASVVLWTVFEVVLALPSLSLISPLVALFTLSYECSKKETLCAASVGIVCVFVAAFCGSSSAVSSLLLTQNFALIVAVAMAAYALNATRKYAEAAQARADKEAQLREKESQLSAEALRMQEEMARRRSEEQRSSIARDVHDVTAHSLSAVNIQASVALSSLESEPRQAREAIENIRSLSKDALNEIRLLLDMLRNSDDDPGREESPRSPMHTVSDLNVICDYLDSASIDCSLDVDDSLAKSLPVYKQVAIYDMVREAATNIVKHSGAKSTSISLLRCDSGQGDDMDCLCLVVEDDGCGLSGEMQNSSGHGLQGISERARLLGGNTTLESAESGGLKLTISVPVQA